MKQSFIKIGEGLTDLFEFTTLIEYNHTRINRIVYFHTPHSEKQLSSVAIIMNPTAEKHFQAMYIMTNALKYPYPEGNKKFKMINSAAENGYHLCNKLILYCISCFSFSYVFFKYLYGEP